MKLQKATWIAAMLALGLAPLPAFMHGTATALAAPSDGGGDQATQDLQEQAAILNNPASTNIKRDEAARRLVARHSDAATAILRQFFVPPGNPFAQIAIAEAIAQDPQPDALFIDPLTHALGSDARLTAAAAQALVNYAQGPHDIPGALETAVSNQMLPDNSRVAIIKALGGIIQKSVAGYLINKLQDPNESNGVHGAAADALGEMTGLRFQGDQQRWLRWWADNAAQNDDAWRANVLSNKVRQLTQTSLRYTQLKKSLPGILEYSYAQLSPAAKAATIAAYLNSPTPELRAAGAVLVRSDFEGNQGVSPDVRKQLRALIGDSDPGVRQEVVTTLETMNDRDAAPALITQLVQETDPDVKRKIAEALGQMHDPAAVPALLHMLGGDDPIAAADALAQLGPTLRQSAPQQANQVAGALKQKIDDLRKNNGSASSDLLTACVRALAALAPPGSGEIFRSLLSTEQPDSVRIAALDGLRALDDPHYVDPISETLSPDASPEVRLAAARALADIATSRQATQLYNLLDPANETDARVRQAAWAGFQHVLRSKNATVEWLRDWPSQLKDPQRRLVALQALADAIVRRRGQVPPPPADQQEQDDQYLAEQRQNIGDTLMQLNTPEAAADAATAYQLAVNYWRGPGQNQPGSDATLNGLVGGMMDALLTAKQYENAIDFAEKQLQISPSYQPTVGGKIKNEAARLQRAGDSADASRLIDDALKMNDPPLDTSYVSDLKMTRDDINNSGNTSPAPPGTGGP